LLRVPPLGRGTRRRVAVRAAVVLAAFIASSRDAGARPAFSCTDRYVVIRAHGPLVGPSADALVVGPTTVELAPRCPEAAFRVSPAGRGWRLVAPWPRGRAGGRRSRRSPRAAATASSIRAPVKYATTAISRPATAASRTARRATRARRRSRARGPRSRRASSSASAAPAATAARASPASTFAPTPPT